MQMTDAHNNPHIQYSSLVIFQCVSYSITIGHSQSMLDIPKSASVEEVLQRWMGSHDSVMVECVDLIVTGPRGLHLGGLERGNARCNSGPDVVIE